jgi:hypothetical protein
VRAQYWGGKKLTRRFSVREAELGRWVAAFERLLKLVAMYLSLAPLRTSEPTTGSAAACASGPAIF